MAGIPLAGMLNPPNHSGHSVVNPLQIGSPKAPFLFLLVLHRIFRVAIIGVMSQARRSEFHRNSQGLLVFLSTSAKEGCSYAQGRFQQGGCMIKMTERAAQEVKTIVTSKSLPETTILRVDARPVEGKKELHLTLKLDTKEPESDDVVESTAGTRLAVDETVAEALGDLRLDYREDSGNFIFERPEPTA
jgi:Fe-S cluster assembly iron-binding protein IscA